MAEHLVDFYKYCKTCEYYSAGETEDPCNECLTYPTNTDSKKPIRYKEKDK